MADPSIRPLITFFSDPATKSISVSNTGLGPAIIDKVWIKDNDTLTSNNQFEAWQNMFKSFEIPTLNYSITELDRSIAKEGNYTLIRLDSTLTDRDTQMILDIILKRLEITIEYHSADNVTDSVTWPNKKTE